MDTKLIQPDDYKYFVEKPDSSFSPKRNQAIINETIRETEKYFREIGQVIDDNLGNRLEVVGSYGRYRFNKGTKTFKAYVGDRFYTELIGEKILQKVRVADTVNKLNGNTKWIGKGMIQL
jgi:hypothetical protein